MTSQPQKIKSALIPDVPL